MGEGGGGNGGGREACGFRDCGQGPLIEKVTCEKRWKGSKGMGPVDLWGKSIHSKQWERQVQRS